VRGLERAKNLPTEDSAEFNQWKKELDDWTSEWQKKARDYCNKVELEFGEEDRAIVEAPKHYVYDGWMRFARPNLMRLRLLLAVLRTYRHDWNPLVQPPEADVHVLSAWAENHLQPLVKQVIKEMSRIEKELTEPEKAAHLAEVCLRYWRQNQRGKAKENFEIWLELHPDRQRAKADALSGMLKTHPELEPIRQYWHDKQKEKKLN
jgi:hypothetical protein